MIDFLNERFSRMKLKGNPIKVCQAAMEDEVVDNFESVHFIEKSLTMGDLTQETLKNAKDWQAFLKDHCNYKKFEELYGQLPSEVDRPSLAASSVTSEAKEADKENKKLMIAAKVRDIIVCIDCKKPRCVYSFLLMKKSM